MSYSDYEKSAESGRPIELYHFTLATTHYRYTSAEDTYNWSSQDWLPRQISRTAPSQSSEERRQQMEIILPASDPVAIHYIGIVPGQPMTLEITRVHRDDPAQEGLVLWDGRITGASYQKGAVQCVLQGLTTEATFSRPLPRFKYQSMCNHVLYDTLCTINKASHIYTNTVSGVSGDVITVTGLGSAEADDWAKGGYVTLDDEDWRLILDHTGDDLTLLLPFEQSAVGQSVDVFAGCDHSLTVCNTKFSNTINFGGFPYVPTRNPFATGIT